MSNDGRLREASASGEQGKEAMSDKEVGGCATRKAFRTTSAYEVCSSTEQSLSSKPRKQATEEVAKSRRVGVRKRGENAIRFETMSYM